MEPSYDIRLKLQERKLARERANSSSSSSDKENHVPAGLGTKQPKRFGRGRGLIHIRQEKAANNSDGRYQTLVNKRVMRLPKRVCNLRNSNYYQF